MQSRNIAKAPTGIQGLDEITFGGLPAGRPTLVSGGAGCGKTLLAMEFLVRGATQFDEPGVFVAFEETAEELAQNVLALGLDLDEVLARDELLIEHIHIERSEIEETGQYDLEGLFIRLGYAIDSIGAKRVVLDTIEVLFGGLADHTILRAELRRLFRWLKDKGVTAIITGERGDTSLTRHGLEEFVSDCVIVLDHRVIQQRSTRRLRVVKYRGSTHGTNEYPFLIGSDGISVLPITSLGLEHMVTPERISTGVAGLDAMLGGQGFYRASSVLVTGTAGTGKTSLAAHFATETCRRGEGCLYFAYEESENQLVRNMGSIGVDLSPWLQQGLLHMSVGRPSAYGLEMHLVAIHKLVAELSPRAVVIDPLTAFLKAGSEADAEAMLTRLIDWLKLQKITALFTSLTRDDVLESELGVTSLVDTWITLRDEERDRTRGRSLCVLKSRGMAHDRNPRNYRLDDAGFVFEGGDRPLAHARES
jgi:circadian clock protein KaiC